MTAERCILTGVICLVELGRRWEIRRCVSKFWGDWRDVAVTLQCYNIELRAPAQDHLCCVSSFLAFYPHLAVPLGQRNM